MSSPRYEILLPDTLFHERYRIVHCIKAGGMGAIYEVVDETTDTRRALKVMLPSLVDDADLRARFELEARVTGRIESDHLARVSDAGVDDATGMPFLVMDLLHGEELGSLLIKRKHLPPGEVVLYLFEAALALDKTHAAGIVHRDLKPENLFVTHRDDGSPCIKVFDFGIAKVVDRGSKRATRAMGTPLYMAPEQIRGEGSLGPPVDLYALGHIAYTLLVGEAYWSEEIDTGQTLFATLSTIILGSKEPPSARAMRRRGISLPQSFDTWFTKATAPRPEDRFQHATEAVALLAVAVGVSLPRASLAVPPVTTQPLPVATEHPDSPPVANQKETLPLKQSPALVMNQPVHLTPTELMGAAITSPPPPPRRKKALVASVILSSIATLLLVVGLLTYSDALSTTERPAVATPALAPAVSQLVARLRPAPPRETAQPAKPPPPPGTSTPTATPTATPTVRVAPNLVKPPKQPATTRPAAPPATIRQPTGIF